MGNSILLSKLEQERRKLIQLINQALEQGIPITQNETILEQSRKVDALIIAMQKNARKSREAPPEC